MKRVIFRATCSVVLARVVKTLVLVLTLVSGVPTMAMADVPIVSQILANTKTLARAGVAGVESLACSAKVAFFAGTIHRAIRRGVSTGSIVLTKVQLAAIDEFTGRAVFLRDTFAHKR